VTEEQQPLDDLLAPIPLKAVVPAVEAALGLTRAGQSCAPRNLAFGSPDAGGWPLPLTEPVFTIARRGHDFCVFKRNMSQ
jgi:hypothetical protein